MKHFSTTLQILTFFLSFFIIASCGDDSKEAPISVLPPTIVEPANGMTCSPIELNFVWEASKVENSGEEVVYEIYLGTTEDAMSRQDEISDLTYRLSSLQKGQEYYWKVVGKVGDKTASSSVLSFRTESEQEVASLPQEPLNPNPENNASISADHKSKITLAWSSNQTGVTYYVYLDENAHPQTLVGETKEKQMQVAVSKGKTYYWQVAIEDQDGNKNVSLVWTVKVS